LVYTAGAIGVKQDVTLQHISADNLKYGYELELGDTYAARLEKSGANCIYGTSFATERQHQYRCAKMRRLLKKAREKAAKDKLLFELPAPKIREANGHFRPLPLNMS